MPRKASSSAAQKPIARKLATNIRRAADGDFPPGRRPYEDPVKGQEWVGRRTSPGENGILFFNGKPHEIPICYLSVSAP